MHPTHADVVRQDSSSHDYYLSLAKELGISYAGHPDIDKAKQMVDQGDLALASVPASVLTPLVEKQHEAITKAVESRGHFYTLSGGICIHRAAILDAVEQKFGVIEALHRKGRFDLSSEVIDS